MRARGGRAQRALLALGAVLLPASAAPQSDDAGAADAQRPSFVALRVARPPAIDGRLTEDAWTRAEPATGFTQRNPDEGLPASERTEVRVLYDESALYIGARLFDSDPRGIGRRMSSRDDVPDADWVNIHLDPLHDHLTGAQFAVSAAGVQGDAVISNDISTDWSWDAVWASAVSLDEMGWSAEIRIPFSQLRFPREAQQTWGINVSRYIRRKAETVWFELVPSNESGLASRMGHLTGLDEIVPGRQLEVLPYTAARAEFVQPRSGDPFNDGARGFGAAGLDLKWRMTPNLTLDGTVNPDFGQVEVDPAVVNLSAFETFFSERRPFFIEGAQIFSFGRGGVNNNLNINSREPSIFHSRRIGRAPQLRPTAEYADAPIASTILGAVKLSGKTSSGWSLGLIEAVTQREEAKVQTDGIGGREVVEPRTNYAVGRILRDIGARASVGMLATSVVRDLDTDRLRAALPEQAFVVGGDGHWFFSDRRDWVVNGKFSVSHVSGSPEVITQLQEAPQRYYQRPDAPHVSVDPSRTSLTGFTTRVNLNRNQGNWQINASLWATSPGFESNDLGFHTDGDRAGTHVVLFRRQTVPGRFSRNWQLAVGRAWTWNFNREVQTRNWIGFGRIQFHNYWNLQSTWFASPEALSDRLTRGGPSTAAPGGGNLNINLNTDSRQVVSFGFNTSRNWSDVDSWSQSFNLSVDLKPLPALTISTGPSWNHSRSQAQYLRTQTDSTATNTFGHRYVFGTIDQRQLAMTTRVSYGITPRMSLQLFMQPLLAVGDYSQFKELAAPRTFDFRAYGGAGTSLLFDESAQRYTADPDGGGPSPSFSFFNPDFNFKSLRLNLVYRWEVQPGSNLFVVWTRQQQDFADPGQFRFGRDAGALFTAPGDDIFLVKMAYWFST